MVCDTLLHMTGGIPPDKEPDMRNFLQRLAERYRQFMVGRYGSDQLSRFTMLLAFAMLILNMIFRTKTSLFYWLVWVFLLLTYFRMFSRNIQKRYDENTRFLQLKEKVRGWFGGRRGGAGAGGRDSYQNYSQAYENARSEAPKNAMRSDREHRIFRCPNCDQRVRVPRGRGKIEITCPRCGHQFIKRS